MLYYFSICPSLPLYKNYRPVPSTVYIKFLGIPDPYRYDTDPTPRICTTGLRIPLRIRILLFSSVALKMTRKNKFFLLITGTATHRRYIYNQSSEM
jgi:hypothetical protein